MVEEKAYRFLQSGNPRQGRWPPTIRIAAGRLRGSWRPSKNGRGGRDLIYCGVGRRGGIRWRGTSECSTSRSGSPGCRRWAPTLSGWPAPSTSNRSGQNSSERCREPAGRRRPAAGQPCSDVQGPDPADPEQPFRRAYRVLSPRPSDPDALPQPRPRRSSAGCEHDLPPLPASQQTTSSGHRIEAGCHPPSGSLPVATCTFTPKQTVSPPRFTSTLRWAFPWRCCFALAASADC